MSLPGTHRAFLKPVIQSRAGRLLVLFVLLLPLWWPIFVSGETFYTRDTANYFIPQKSMEVHAVRDGVLPSWNPRLRLGLPHVANPTMGALDPLNVVHHLIPGSLGVSLRMLLSIFLIAWGAFLLARRLGADEEGAFLSAYFCAVSGPVLAYLMNPSFLNPLGYAWIAPLAFLSPMAPLYRAAGMGLGVALVLLAGDPQLALILGILCACWAIASKDRKAEIFVLFGAGLVSLILVLPQLLESQQLFSISTRADGSGVGEEEWALPLTRLIDFVVPSFLGRTLPEYSFFGGGAYTETGPVSWPWFESVHAGSTLMIPLVLIVFLRRNDGAAKAHRAALFGVIFLLTLSVGAKAGLLTALAGALPPLGLFRFPEKYAAFAVLSLACLSGVGWTHLRRGALPQRHQHGVAIVSLMLGVFALSVGFWVPGSLGNAWALEGIDVSQEAKSWLLLSGTMSGVLLLLLAGAMLSQRRQDIWFGALFVGALLQALVFCASYVHTAQRAIFDQSVQLAQDESVQGRVYVDAYLRKAHLTRDETGYQKQMARDLGMMSRTPGVANDVRLVAGYTAAHIDTGFFSWMEQNLFVRPQQVFPLLAMERYLGPDLPFPRSIRARMTAVLRPSEKQNWSDARGAPVRGVRVHETIEKNPFVRCYVNARVASSKQAWNDLDADPSLDPSALVLVPKGQMERINLDPNATDPALDVVHRGPGRWQIKVETKAPCLLTVFENYEPGWSVEVNGQSAAIVQPFGAFVGVWLSPGVHRVHFAHRARHAPFALLGVLLALGVTVLAVRARKRGASTA